MDDSLPHNTQRNQTIFAAFMFGLGIGLVSLVSVNAGAPHAGITLQTIFALGDLIAALGLIAAVFQHPRLLLLVSAALAGVGVTALLLLTLLPNPRLDPMLFQSGNWRVGPAPLHSGWAHMGMAMLFIASGVALPFAKSPRQEIALASLTLLRFTLWAGAFWQLAYLALFGQFDHLWDKPASASIQLGIVVVMLSAWPILMQGDRRWLATLIGRDNSVALARFILPVALLPSVGGYLVRTWSQLGSYDDEVAPLLNIEISSAGLLLLGTAALRSLWIERRNRETLAQALQRSPVIVQSANDGVIEYWPKECELMFGFSSETAVGKRAADLLQTEYQVPEAVVEAALDEEGEWAGETRRTTREGAKIWVATRLVLVRPAEGVSAKIVETLTDISDLKRAMTELEITTDSLTQAVGTYELGLVEYDPTTLHISFSEEFERIVGAEPGALERNAYPWTSFVTADEAEALRRLVAQDIERRAAERPIDVQVRRLDGETRNLNGRFRYRYESSGGLRRLVGIFRDVTEQVRDRAEVEVRGERLLDMQSEMAHTSRLSAMGEMAAALAHELNQPLTAVANTVGAIELIIKDPNKPFDDKKRQQVLRAARHAEAQAVRAGEIIRRLREFISRGETDTNVESLGRLIDDALALALPNPRADGVEIRKSVAVNAAKVMANRVQIQQVLVNLIRNAVESMQGQFGPKQLTVDARGEDGMALVTISDTGPGVPADLVDRLFSPFISSKPGGMGVGLSICRRIVEGHGGKLWFEERDGIGATFKFTLPLA